MNDQLAHLYTSLEEAAGELHARRGSVGQGADSVLESHLARQPYAVLFRQVATPNFELERFACQARAGGLSPLVLEFHRDKFVTRNSIKYALGRMGFYGGTGRNGGARVRFLSVVDLPATDGVALHHATTAWGQGLIEFHHELLRERPALHGLELYDGSNWFLGHGRAARHYYTEFLSLFVRHAVLFESFLTSPPEQQFTDEVVLPAFEATCAQHGRRPLICRLDPPHSEGHGFWLQYPDELHPSVSARLSAGSIPSPQIRTDARSLTS